MRYNANMFFVQNVTTRSFGNVQFVSKRSRENFSISIWRPIVVKSVTILKVVDDLILLNQIGVRIHRLELQVATHVMITFLESDRMDSGLVCVYIACKNLFDFHNSTDNTLGLL